MTLRRKREERGVPIPLAGGGLVLEGRFVPAASDVDEGAVVAPPHPLYGGSMDSPVVAEIAWRCNEAGLASLCFNWRGVGASAGAPSGELFDADADFAAALEQLAETLGGPLVAAGYSFGAAAAARAAAASPRVNRLVLVSPPPSLLGAGMFERFGQRALVITGEHDAIAPPAAVAPLAEAAGARFVPIPDADHFYQLGLAALSTAVGTFFTS